MTLALTFLGMALAAEPIARPGPPEAVDGECEKVYPINRGQPLSEKILSPPGLARCSGVVVPLSQFADLLQTETWATAVSSRYAIDTAEYEMQIDWYKAKLEEESKPTPFIERPSTQRWFGRLETLATVGIVAAGLGAAYQYGSGVTK